jgi:hypothetical protein
MKLKDDNGKEGTWRTKIRQALSSLSATGSKWKFPLLLVCTNVLILLIIGGLSLSLVAPTESAENLVISSLYRLNIEPSEVFLAVHGIRSENIGIPGHLVRGWMARPEHISIDIKNNDFLWLSHERETALAQGIWTGSNETVPAVVRYRDEKINADVRLKGNSIGHWGTDAWSLKFKTDGDCRFFGMREFAIEKPVTREYLTEWVFQRLLSSENIPHVQFSYVDVEVNGKEMGIYALEESPEDRLLDSEGYPAGPIFHINDEIWQERLAGFAIKDDMNNRPVELYNGKQYDSSDRGELVRKGSDLFDAFRDGTLNTTEAFDLRTLATFMAISDLTGNHNGNLASNVKPYYNPVTSKLELIGNDAKTEPIDTIFYLYDRQFNQRISKDPVFVQLYVHELERVSDPEYLDQFFSENKADFEQNLSFMYKENPFYHFPLEIYDHNRKVIRQTIYPYRVQYSYLENVTPEGIVNIEAGAAQPMPVEVLGLRLNGKLLPRIGGVGVLPGNNFEDVTDYQMLAFHLPEGIDQINASDNITLECRVLGTTPVRSEAVIGKARLSDWALREDIVRRQPNPEQFSWLHRDDGNLTFTIQPGKWEIEKDLVIPERYTVLSQPGDATQLDLIRGAMILSYSSLILAGKEDMPFEITSSDGSGQGILVLDAENTSLLSYVRIRNLSEPDRNGWKVPASVTFYQSPVIIDHSEFLDGNAEGSLLSIVRGSTKISDSGFMRSKGDLLTSEYSSVEAADTLFLGTARSGITGTGSRIAVRRSNFVGPLTFGIQGMRASNITADNSFFSGTRIAGAAEDGSEIDLQDCSINSSIVGLAAYTNTPGYGPGRIASEHSQFVNTKIPYLTEKGSSVSTGSSPASTSESKVFSQVKEIIGIPA